jgi:hypothetical protein
MTRNSSIAVGGFVAAAMLALGVVSATASSGRESHTLTGAWIVTVDRGPAGVLKSLQTYGRGGGFVETSNAVPNTMRGPGHGAWSRAGHRRYDTTQLFFRYDPQTGAFLGYLKLRSRIELNRDGNSFSALTMAQPLDAGGNPIGPPRSDSAVGERVGVEPIPG